MIYNFSKDNHLFKCKLLMYSSQLDMFDNNKIHNNTNFKDMLSYMCFHFYKFRQGNYLHINHYIESNTLKIQYNYHQQKYILVYKKHILLH